VSVASRFVAFGVSPATTFSGKATPSDEDITISFIDKGLHGKRGNWLKGVAESRAHS